MIHRFGALEIDEARREIRRGRQATVPSPKVLDLLLYLIRHHDRVVPRAELLDQFWPDTEDTESAMSMCLTRARRAIRGAATIRSFARRGVRFVGASDARPSQRGAHYTPPPVRRDLVGRDREAARLSRLVEAVLAGHSSVALISGEPGIGKTRLLEELVWRARARGVEALIAKCDQGATPFAPWERVIAAYAAARDVAELRATFGVSNAALAHFVPAFRMRSRRRALAAHADPQQARAQLFDAVATFLGRVTAQRPIVLVFDDLQWADASSLLLLQLVARALRDAAVLVAVTYRDEALQPSVLNTLDVLRRGQRVEQMALSALDDADACALVRQLGDMRLQPETIARIVAKAEGNPLFIGEYWRHLGAGEEPGAASTPSTELPTTINAVIGSRLAALSPACGAVVEVAAALGREFDYRVLARTSGFADDVLLDALDEATRQRVLVPVRGVPEQYRFAHALIRDVAYQRVGAAERAQLHAQVGASLEQLFAGDFDAHLPELALHFTQAGEDGDVEKGIAYSTRAGEQAHAEVAYEEAAAYFEQALAGLDLYRPHLQSHRRELLISCGDAYLHAGDQARAAAAYAQANDKPLDGAATMGTAPPPRLITRMNFVVHLREETLAGESWRDVRVRREAHTRLAVGRARCSGDLSALAVALADRRLAAMGPQFVLQHLALSTEWLDVAEELGDVEMLQEARLFRINDLIERGRIDAADKAIAAYARTAERHPQPLFAWVLAFLKSMRAQLAGEFATAERLAQAALATGEAIAGDLAQQVFAVQMAVHCSNQGRGEEMASLLEVMVEQMPNAPVARIALASAYCMQQRPEDARRHFEVVAAHDFAALDAQPTTWVSSLTSLVLPCLFLGDRPRAQWVYDQLLPLADTCVVYGLAFGFGGGVAGYLGALAHGLDRWDDATAHFERGLDLATRMGARPTLAHTQYAYAQALLARNRRAHRKRVSALLDAAAATAAEFGLPGLSADVAKLR